MDLHVGMILELVWCWFPLGGANFEFSFPIEASAANNQAEYRAILKGIQLLWGIKADAVEILEIPCWWLIS